VQVRDVAVKKVAHKNERDSLTRVNSSNPRTVLGVRIGAAPEIV
jgi:hypothetical protein